LVRREEYKQALSSIDRNTRICLLHLENVIDERLKTTLEVRTSQNESKPDLSEIEAKLDSLQKQIDGLRVKVEKAEDLVQSHDKQETYLKNLADTAQELIDEAKRYYEELYKSGHFKEGDRRKIREEKLIKKS
jgi:uncharacterized coiled-coil DUF342 family protein